MELVGLLFHGLQGKNKAKHWLLSQPFWFCGTLGLWFLLLSRQQHKSAGTNVNVHEAAWLGHWGTAPQRSCSLAWVMADVGAQLVEALRTSNSECSAIGGPDLPIPSPCTGAEGNSECSPIGGTYLPIPLPCTRAQDLQGGEVKWCESKRVEMRTVRYVLSHMTWLLHTCASVYDMVAAHMCFCTWHGCCTMFFSIWRGCCMHVLLYMTGMLHNVMHTTWLLHTCSSAHDRYVTHMLCTWYGCCTHVLLHMTGILHITWLLNTWTIAAMFHIKQVENSNIVKTLWRLHPWLKKYWHLVTALGRRVNFFCAAALVDFPCSREWPHTCPSRLSQLNLAGYENKKEDVKTGSGKKGVGQVWLKYSV